MPVSLPIFTPPALLSGVAGVESAVPAATGLQEAMPAELVSNAAFGSVLTDASERGRPMSAQAAAIVAPLDPPSATSVAGATVSADDPSSPRPENLASVAGFFLPASQNAVGEASEAAPVTPSLGAASSQGFVDGGLPPDLSTATDVKDAVAARLASGLQVARALPLSSPVPTAAPVERAIQPDSSPESASPSGAPATTVPVDRPRQGQAAQNVDDRGIIARAAALFASAAPAAPVAGSASEPASLATPTASDLSGTVAQVAGERVSAPSGTVLAQVAPNSAAPMDDSKTAAESASLGTDVSRVPGPVTVPDGSKVAAPASSPDLSVVSASEAKVTPRAGRPAAAGAASGDLRKPQAEVSDTTTRPGSSRAETESTPITASVAPVGASDLEGQASQKVPAAVVSGSVVPPRPTSATPPSLSSPVRASGTASPAIGETPTPVADASAAPSSFEAGGDDTPASSGSTDRKEHSGAVVSTEANAATPSASLPTGVVQVQPLVAPSVAQPEPAQPAVAASQSDVPAAAVVETASAQRTVSRRGGRAATTNAASLAASPGDSAPGGGLGDEATAKAVAPAGSAPARPTESVDGLVPVEDQTAAKVSPLPVFRPSAVSPTMTADAAPVNGGAPVEVLSKALKPATSAGTRKMPSTAAPAMAEATVTKLAAALTPTSVPTVVAPAGEVRAPASTAPETPAPDAGLQAAPLQAANATAPSEATNRATDLSAQPKPSAPRAAVDAPAEAGKTTDWSDVDLLSPSFRSSPGMVLAATPAAGSAGQLQPLVSAAKSLSAIGASLTAEAANLAVPTSNPVLLQATAKAPVGNSPLEGVVREALKARGFAIEGAQQAATNSQSVPAAIPRETAEPAQPTAPAIAPEVTASSGRQSPSSATPDRLQPAPASVAGTAGETASVPSAPVAPPAVPPTAPGQPVSTPATSPAMTAAATQAAQAGAQSAISAAQPGTEATVKRGKPGKSDKKTVEVIGVKGKTDEAAFDGIASAQTTGTMSSSSRNNHESALAADLTAAVPSLDAGSKNGGFGSGTQDHASQPRSEFAGRTLAVVRDVSEHMQAKAAQTVQFSVGLNTGEQLGVHLQYRAGVLHTTFQTDSGELREAITREWQASMPSVVDGSNPVRLARPDFSDASPAPRGGLDLGGQSGRDSQAFQQQTSRDLPQRSSGFAMPARSGRSSGSASSASPAVESVPASRPLVETARHLQTFA